jgi:LmbE family N-acetylglucosaminyl deacetylase
MISRIRSLFAKPFEPKKAAVIVAHPDDETLWAGGTILANPNWEWFVLSLCRGSDKNRQPRFWKALNALDAMGNIADLHDGPDQKPLPQDLMEETIERLLPRFHYDVIFTHGPQGEYTRHLRHEEVSSAVANLWLTGRISATSVMMFSYEDGDRSYLPRPRREAHICELIKDDLWQAKHRIMTHIYNFAPDSWEAQTTPREEAFWQFDSPESLQVWLQAEGVTQ